MTVVDWCIGSGGGSGGRGGRGGVDLFLASVFAEQNKFNVKYTCINCLFLSTQVNRARNEKKNVCSTCNCNYGIMFLIRNLLQREIHGTLTYFSIDYKMYYVKYFVHVVIRFIRMSSLACVFV